MNLAFDNIMASDSAYSWNYVTTFVKSFYKYNDMFMLKLSSNFIK